MTSKILASLLVVLTLAALGTAQDGNICISDSNVYTVRVNLYAGELGESLYSA